MPAQLSLFALHCINSVGRQSKGAASPGSPGSPTLGDRSALSSNLSAVAVASDATALPKPTPDEYERTSCYNGIARDSDHPELVYRTDYSTTHFPKPAGTHFHLPVKSLRGVYDIPLNGVWDTVGPEIRDLIKAREIRWSSIDSDPARFFTHGPLGEEKGSLGPVVVWIGVLPGSTSSDTADAVSQEILEIFPKNGVEDAVVERREAVPQKLTGLPLMRHVGSDDATHHVCRFLTALLDIPRASGEMEEEDAQGTLTLWFHENKDKNGNPSKNVFGVSNCRVLRKDTAVDWEHRRGARPNHVRVCGKRRFQRGFDEIKKAVSDHGIMADLWAREILDDEITREWSSIKLHRDIGQVQYAVRITVGVGGGTRYTSDWAAFLASEAKVRQEFEGNVVDLGLVSFTLNEVGIESVELGIYNFGFKSTEPFPAKGDSGSLVWYTKNGKAFIVGQLHSGHNKGGSTSNHVTYCYPGWYLLQQIKKFKYADFYSKTWSS
ncbi:hypothetical protein K488DRAFT_89093 [Vararia minispora EC-137]|uniref:Uncharacterized protein n=1 Tax=Vararia minispora EC-137 TaxID=1314806 RepID=A0ACB8QB62_9AGAM|nr:hypothetical protein K488DRAFT_89093 [Vararia minispora EC-137]